MELFNFFKKIYNGINNVNWQSTDTLNFVLHELLKNKNFCTLKNDIFTLNLNNYKTNEYYSPKNTYVFFPKKLKQKVLDCLNNNKSMYINLTLTNLGTPHANTIIITKKNKVIEIERYEPHGKCSDNVKIDIVLRKAFKKVFSGLNFKYFGVDSFCPYFGAQAYSNDTIGYCAVFSLYYAYYRLNHPELNRKQAANYFKNRKPKKVFEDIQEFDKRVGIILNLKSFHKKIKLFITDLIDIPKKLISYDFIGKF